MVLEAEPLLQLAGGVDQLMPLEGWRGEVRLQVKLAVGGEAHQAGPDSFVFCPGAGITLHVTCLGTAEGQRVRKRSWDGHQLYLFHNLSQHSVLAKNRQNGEAVSALWAGVDSLVIVVPVGFDAGHAVRVSTGNGDGFSQEIEAY